MMSAAERLGPADRKPSCESDPQARAALPRALPARSRPRVPLALPGSRLAAPLFQSLAPQRRAKAPEAGVATAGGPPPDLNPEFKPGFGVFPPPFPPFLRAPALSLFQLAP
ncbi:formin-like protein 1 [Papio anubis]|uniref:formin-like protein 1 n=1 Tax=Papio anubis TaxID=9555 RepID=UPI000B7B7056|nr:formin-like protein 1 [Papio anubis]XP_028698122.1 formin-like protein 1 [Macaca mulatta]